MSGQEPEIEVTSPQPGNDELAFPNLKPGDAWGESITKRRAGQLAAVLQKWEAEEEHGQRKGPFDSNQAKLFIMRLSGADVFWLAAQALAGSNQIQAIAATARSTGLHLPHNSTRLDILHLECAFLGGAHLEGANLRGVHLEGANLVEAYVQGADFTDTRLEGAYFGRAHVQGSRFADAHLEGAELWDAHLEGANLGGAHLEGATLSKAQCAGAIFTRAHMEGASLRGAHLEGANLVKAHLQGRRMAAEDKARIRQWASRFPDMLLPADIRLAFFNGATALNDVVLGSEKSGYVSLADVRWGDVNLAVVDWTRTKRGFLVFRQRIEAIELGDEREACTAKNSDNKPKSKATRLQEFKDAVRATRQLATVLRQQGLNEDADRFAYKAQKLQRQVLRRQRRYGAALGSWFLDIIAGYGYNPMRSLIAYFIIVCAFAAAYLINAQFAAPHLTWDEALVLSISAFHGRGFFTSGINLGDTLARLAAGEAIIGLLIEITFIATFTQRFFAR